MEYFNSVGRKEDRNEAEGNRDWCGQYVGRAKIYLSGFLLRL